ncbi:MAG TPA: hypothetical protein VHC86_04115, partial [Opitutaceae bacterium]|nr:hypothetical protein [Opitutaceae bacterium]
MEDEADKEAPPAADFNKIDLSQLQGFSFGTQWTQDKASPGRSDSRERPRREFRHDDGGERAGGHKDRRAFRRPSGGEGAPGSGPEASRGAGGEHRGGPRRPHGHGGYEGGPRRRGPEREAPPYVSPYFAATFYPEDASFGALVKTIRASCRTIELFEIARTVLAKPDRFTVLVGRKTAERAPDGAAPAEAAPPRAPLYVSVPDGIPFESEEAAVTHVMSKHLGLFFDQAEVEIEPPKGNFQVVSRCTITGELLGPPNYHRYNQIVQQHHAERIDRMSLEAYRSRIESVRDPELIKQWLEKMKKATRYTWKAPARPEPPAPAAPAAAPAP